MNIEQILELMDELLDSSSTVPFSNKKMVDAEQMHEYIDSIRLNIPTEIKKAKDVTRDRKNIMAETQKEADEIIKRAEERAKVLISEQEILKQAAEYAKAQVQQANDQAADIIAQAQEKEKAIRGALAANLNKTLTEAQQVLAKNLKDVNSTLDAVSRISPQEQQEA